MLRNQANKSIITVDFPGLKNYSLSLISLRLEEGISTLDQIELIGRIPCNSQSSSYLNQTLHLSWDTEKSEQHYHGWVTCVSTQTDQEEAILLKLTCMSFLGMMQYTRQTRHFTRQPLSLIVNILVKDNKIPFLNVTFHTPCAHQIREYRAQQDESDYSFFERILHDSGCFYLQEHKQSGVVLHIYDNSQTLPRLCDPVLFYPLFQGTKPIDSLYEIYSSEQLITQGQLIQSHASLKPSEIIKKSKTFTDQSGLGYSIEKALSVESQTELDQYAQLRFEQNQQASASLSARSDRRDLRAGLIFTLKDHPIEVFNQSYLIVSVVHEVNEESQGLRYLNKLICQPATIPYRAAYEPNHILMNTLSFSHIHSETESPELTQQGEYLLKSPYNDELTHPVRASTYYSGDNYGMHFPLHDRAQVIIAHLNGHPDKPLILGSLFNDEQRNVVNTHNALQNRLVTHAGHELLLDDTPDEQKILLHTPNLHHRLLLDASLGNEKIDLVSETGEMHVEISKGGQFKTENHFHLSAEQSIEIKAKDDVSFFSEQANMICEAAQDITHRAGQDISWHAENNISLRTDRNLDIQVGQSMRTDIEAGDYQLKVDAGNLTEHAQGNIQFTSSSGNIVLQTANASVSLMADGTLLLNAKKIILEAQTIDIHQSGETKEN